MDEKTTELVKGQQILGRQRELEVRSSIQVLFQVEFDSTLFIYRPPVHGTISTVVTI